MNYYQSNTVYQSTDAISNLINVTVNGNTLTILNDSYILPSPILFKQQVNLPNTLVYVTSMLNGIIQSSVQVTVSINQLDEVVPVVMYNNYYFIPNGTVFNAQTVTVNNNQITAQLDPNSINQSKYIGNSFSIFGNVLTASTNLSPVQPSSVTVGTASSTGTTSTTTATGTTGTTNVSSVSG